MSPDARNASQSEPLFKWLKANGKTTFGRSGWDLPTRNDNGWKPGKWIRAKGELSECENGIHLCRASDLIDWVGERLYRAEADGRRIDARDKIVVRRARLIEPVETINEKTLRLFAADCAESVLHLFEAQYPDDDRPRKAIGATRQFALGEIGAAARDTARDAARAAAWAAAGDAERAAARAVLNDRLLLYVEHGEAAADIPVLKLGEPVS